PVVRAGDAGAVPTAAGAVRGPLGIFKRWSRSQGCKAYTPTPPRLAEFSDNLGVVPGSAAVSAALGAPGRGPRMFAGTSCPGSSGSGRDGRAPREGPPAAARGSSEGSPVRGDRRRAF